MSLAGLEQLLPHQIDLNSPNGFKSMGSEAAMGFMSPDLPDVDHESWASLPRAERLKVVTRHWAENGFGTPYAVYLLYLMKIGLYVAIPAVIIALTPGLGGLSHIADWWTQPIVYQKAIVFTLLFEILGLGCGSGPLTGRFMPPIGGVLYWLRPKTIRLPPWPGKVPFTGGDSRTIVDVVLYAAVLVSAVWALLAPGDGPVTAAGDVGLINPILVIPTIVALARRVKPFAPISSVCGEAAATTFCCARKK